MPSDQTHTRDRKHQGKNDLRAGQRHNTRLSCIKVRKADENSHLHLFSRIARSSLDLTHRLAKDFDGIIHWARDTETYQSIVKSFVRLDLESVGPPELPESWSPEITFMAANGS